MNENLKFDIACTLEDQAVNLVDILKSRLDKLKQGHVKWCRLNNVYQRAFDRYQRRARFVRQCFNGLKTQQIATAVEREAFPSAPVFVHEPEYSFNDEYNQVVYREDDEEGEEDTNSGDLARHPAGAPVLAAISQGVGSSVGQVAGQGGIQTKPIDWIRHAWSFIYRRARILPYPKPQPQQCQRDDIFVNAFCPCPECSKHHDELAGIHHARAFWVKS